MKSFTLALSLLLLFGSTYTEAAIDCEHAHNKLVNGSFEEIETYDTDKVRFTGWKISGEADFVPQQGYEVCGDFYGHFYKSNSTSQVASVFQEVFLTDDTKNVIFTVFAAKGSDNYSNIQLIFLNSLKQEISASTKMVVISRTFPSVAGLGEYTLKSNVPDGAKYVKIQFNTQNTSDNEPAELVIDGAVLVFQTETTLDTSLPVVLASVSASTVENNIELSWQTASEVNTQSFEVQHSANGISWNTLAAVNASGNFTGLLNYRFVHTQPAAGVNYYRLKMVDLDGTFAYSKIVNAVYSRTAINAYLYPNPTTGKVAFGAEQARDVAVFDLSGNAVFTKSGRTEGLDLTSLRNGVYMVSWMDETNQKFTQRLVISR